MWGKTLFYSFLCRQFENQSFDFLPLQGEPRLSTANGHCAGENNGDNGNFAQNKALTGLVHELFYVF